MCGGLQDGYPPRNGVRDWPRTPFLLQRGPLSLQRARCSVACPAVGALIGVADIDPGLYEPPFSNPLAMVLMISAPRKPAWVAACIKAAIAARSLMMPLAFISPARQAAQ